jgi:hypothetical protein
MGLNDMGRLKDRFSNEANAEQHGKINNGIGKSSDDPRRRKRRRGS